MQPDPGLAARAEAGDAEAQNELGRWYASQPEGAAPAEAWFRRAAEQGLAQAKHNLGVLAHRADRLEEAADWFTAAARDGWIPSIRMVAALYEEAGQAEEAYGVWGILAHRGDAEGQDALGRLAFRLDNAEAFVTARHWSELAAAQGVPSAQARLGTIWHEGLGVERDPERAAAWFLSAARLGHPGAQSWIGTAYHLGVGVEADRVQSAFWLRLGVRQGHDIARAYLPRVEAELSSEEAAQVEAKVRMATGV